MKQWYDFIKAQELELGASTVQKWLASLKMVSFDAGNIYLEANDSIQALWFEEHIRPKIKNLLNSNNRPIKVHIKTANEKKMKNVEKKGPTIHLNSDQLLSDATFATFYENEKNTLAFKLLSEISKNQSAASFNPILIHGPKDSGKTHLLMATAKALQDNGKKIFFVKARTFTDHVVTAIRLSSLQVFRSIYRNVEVLIIDDIHELGGKNATQEEFFHTFNTLHTSGAQIILSANLPPSQLKDIEPRLISRFEWGVSLSLDKVDKNGLQAILQNKLKSLELNINLEAQDFLLKTFLTPSDLQKALQAIVLRSDTLGAVSLSEVASSIKDLISEQNKNELSHDQIIKNVAKHFGLNPEDILGKSQTKECSLPRQIAMFFCREKLKTPYKQLGKLFLRDHSTVMTNIKSIEEKKAARAGEVYFALLEIDRTFR